MLRDQAHAKLNLALNITGLRPDGYHELEMIEVPVALADEVSLIRSTDYCLIANIDLPEGNTVYRAIEAAREVFRFADNFTVVLEKRIPPAAGLGGGSADGAAVLRLLREYYRWEGAEDKLLKIAARVGADVPFCLLSHPAVVRGTGERVEPFELGSEYHALIVKPRQGVSTPQAYAGYDAAAASHPDIRKLRQALAADDEKAIARLMGNSLEAAAFGLNPQIRPLKQELYDLGFDKVLMSGSGSSVFALSKDREALAKAAKHFSGRFEFVKMTEILK